MRFIAAYAALPLAQRPPLSALPPLAAAHVHASQQLPPPHAVLTQQRPRAEQLLRASAKLRSLITCAWPFHGMRSLDELRLRSHAATAAMLHAAACAAAGQPRPAGARRQQNFGSETRATSSTHGPKLAAAPGMHAPTNWSPLPCVTVHFVRAATAHKASRVAYR
eukprot:2343479-Pleurochrysis_carterae.AAC.1